MPHARINKKKQPPVSSTFGLKLIIMLYITYLYVK